MSPLVSAASLAAELGATDLRIIDATLFLPAEERDAAAGFAAAHIAGAQRFDIDAFSDPDSALPHMAPSPGRFAEMAGALGLGDGTRIVCYDQRGLFSAARAWWLIGYFGHRGVAVLDGGLPAWRAAGLPVERGAAGAVAPAVFTATPDGSRVRDLAAMRTTAAHVVDARGAARFHARVAEPRAGMRGGHIPRSANLPYTDLLRPDGTLLPVDALRDRLAAAGIDGLRPVVTTCGSGVTACVITLAMVVAGYGAGAVYDGSWSEWGGRPDTPVET